MSTKLKTLYQSWWGAAFGCLLIVLGCGDSEIGLNSAATGSVAGLSGENCGLLLSGPVSNEFSLSLGRACQDDAGLDVDLGAVAGFQFKVEPFIEIDGADNSVTLGGADLENTDFTISHNDSSDMVVAYSQTGARYTSDSATAGVEVIGSITVSDQEALCLSGIILADANGDKISHVDRVCSGGGQ
tara:strand:+ start:262 stop:819 length:558 start_codon:yes stop_codon:yes gene_type:complete